ncbi:MAG: hypothetical protein ACPIOQ_35940 [Promethearchaeia archaeon]
MQSRVRTGDDGGGAWLSMQARMAGVQLAPRPAMQRDPLSGRSRWGTRAGWHRVRAESGGLACVGYTRILCFVLPCMTVPAV